MQREARKTHHSVGGVEYWLERKRVKNVNLRIHADGTVHVSAPARVSQEHIDQFVASKAAWIAKRQGLIAARNESAPRLWADGERVQLWGEELRMAVVPASSSRLESVAQEGDRLVLHVAPRWLGGSDEAIAHRERLVSQWMTERLRVALPELFSRHEAEMGVHAADIRLRRMKTRWGSCNVRTRVITLNTDLVRFPITCLESVVVHELCHLIEPSHNARFHELQDRYYPTWREARRLLNASPPVK